MTLWSTSRCEIIQDGSTPSDSGAFDRMEPFATEVFSQVAESTKFAGELWPLLVEAGGFGVGLAGGWAGIVGGIALSELGEEGVRSARGEPSRSALEMVESVGTAVFVQAVLHLAFDVGPNLVSKAYRRGATVTIEDLEAQSASVLRSELVRAESPLVERELYAGRSRPVTERGYARQRVRTGGRRRG